MTAMTIDTHAIVKELQAAGFTDVQAEAVTRIVKQVQDIDQTNLTTKADLAEAKADILKWMIGCIGVQTIVIIGAVLALVHAH